MRAVFGVYSCKAQDDSVADGRTGGVNQIQRYGSAVRSKNRIVIDHQGLTPAALSDLSKVRKQLRQVGGRV